MTEHERKVNRGGFFHCRRLCQAMVLFLVVAVAAGFAGAAARENDVVRAVRLAGPAVVNISSQQEIQARANPFSRFGMDPFFDSFFKDFFDPGFQRRYQRTSLGSGVIISGDKGLILTNAHVISKSASISVVLQDEREFNARIVGADPDSDLAVLRIEATEPLPSLAMGDSEDLMIGETIIAIGNPFGFSHTVTTGVVSALHRSIRTEERVFHDFIQTDASINPGNSGGPLLNINGELIGINTAIYAKAQGIGFAIPIHRASRIVSDLIRYGEVILPWIGILIQELDDRVAAYMNLTGKQGLLVRTVFKESPAASAGVQSGDVVLSVGHQGVISRLDYMAAIRNYKPGERLALDVWRKGKIARLSLTAARFPQEQAGNLAFQLLGVKVEDLSDRLRRRYQIPASTGAVITRIDPDSQLAAIGASAGDVIGQIDDLPIETSADFENAVVKYRLKSSVVILLQRGVYGYYITIRM